MTKMDRESNRYDDQEKNLQWAPTPIAFNPKN